MIDAKEEEWRDVVGYEGKYIVSNLGVIKSVTRKVRSGNTQRTVNGKVMTYFYSHIKYVTVSLCNGSGRCSSKLVHRIVAEAFIPNPLGKRYVNHLDGNKHNYKIENLEWCTQSENQIHAVRTGLAKPPPPMWGEDSHSAKLTHIDILMIKILGKHDFTHAQIAKRFGICESHVGMIKRCKTWQHLTSNELEIKL